MQPISSLSAAAARGVKVVFTDIDDTLTTGGKLGAEAFVALWHLADAGLRVVPVTGRPAGWCDCIAREWPVAGVVGENGALAYYEVDGRLERMLHPAVAASSVREKLAAVQAEVLRRVPGSRVAKDQPFRLFDLAIDFREEAPDLGLDVAEQIRAIFAEHGAQAKVSSIHVNGWFGDYDKLSMVQLYAARHLGLDVVNTPERAFFVGDSPNDEPMFRHFGLSAGVANLRRFEGSLQHLPAFVATHEGARGFAEVAAVLLERRQG